MREVTDAVLIMVLPLKSVTSSLLYNVSEIASLMKNVDVKRIIVSSVKLLKLLSLLFR